LLEVHYHATLKDEAVVGDGRWKVVHKGPVPALLSLEPTNLALRQARYENGDALVAAFDGKTPFSAASLERIQELKKFYDFDLDSSASHRLKEIKARPGRKRAEK